MHSDLSAFATRLRGCILAASGPDFPDFNCLALELFALQTRYNPAYQKICSARNLVEGSLLNWTQIPVVPTAAFKELELTCLSPSERTAVFHSSGTTEQKPSRHFHYPESLAVYEASLWRGFTSQFGTVGELVFLTPNSAAAPHSSLIHMFEVIREKNRLPLSAFAGSIASDGTWLINFSAVLQKIENACQSGKPLMFLGTAFSFVHLLDHLAELGRKFKLPAGSKVMETGGYKNRSRVLPKAELHALIFEKLGVLPGHIKCEYGMSELSSQAYDGGSHSRVFRFPKWARAQIISPETGQEVTVGETGLIRIFDLANVFSVAAIQTEDLGIRHPDGFELLGRAQLAEPRGCSLMTA